MWQILSFTGRWHPTFVQELPEATPDEQKTEEQKMKTKAAAEARAKYRLGLSLRRLLFKLEAEAEEEEAQKESGGVPQPAGKEGQGQGKGKRKRGFTQKQMGIVQELENGTLLKEANRLTLISGHGRLRRKDTTFLDTGGSTGGYFRTVMHDWAPPDRSEFEESLMEVESEPDWTPS